MSELHHQFFIIYADGVPSGYLSIETVEKDLYEFQKIYSLPSLHGSGIGRFIIEQGIAYLKTIHPSPFTIELNVNRHNPAVGSINIWDFTNMQPVISISGTAIT